MGKAEFLADGEASRLYSDLLQAFKERTSDSSVLTAGRTSISASVVPLHGDTASVVVSRWPVY